MLTMLKNFAYAVFEVYLLGIMIVLPAIPFWLTR